MGGTAHSSEWVEDEIADRLAHRNFSVCAGIDRQTALSRHSVTFAIDQALGLIWLPRPISSQSPRPEFQNCSWADPFGSWS